ncbi:BTAD domain-containing putative transcriptional regulator [Actinoplanes sp. NPDC026670]|uniref:BTAD domain-containing putative transcriptional regulator n=1 Tax=Actinoplanes sp. NPDC026670 TaxID=3154700 RepID=UPI0033F5721C
MRVRLLGTVDVHDGEEARPVPGLRRKAILSVLALNAGRTVGADRLIDLVWGDRPPATALNTVQSHVSYLRRVLGARAAIVSRPPGYLLDLDGDASDVAAAERLIHTGLGAADPARAAEPLRAALALWRGSPLQDVTEVPWLAEQARRLAGLELEGRRALTEARLALGEHAGLVPELQELAGRHPYDEQIQAQLVLALYRTGRQADALAVVRRARRVLDTELGIDMGPALHDLEAAMLRHDAALTPAREHAGLPPAGDGPALAGRTRELAVLLRRLSAPGVTLVAGDPGIGKTRLLAELSARAQRSGWTALCGRAAEFEQQVPYAVVVDALADHLSRADPALLAVLPDTDRALLAEILPMPGEPGERTTARRTLEAERFLLFRAFRALLETLAVRSGLVLVLDDLHWADPGSAELIAHLLRHPPRGRVVVAAAYRPRQLRGRLRAAAGRAIHDDTAALVELGPLSAAEAEPLLPEELSDDRRHELYAAGGGNPLYLLALARAGAGAGDGGQALRGEFDGLSDSGRTVAQAAAVVGDQADLALIAAAAGLPEDEVARALDTLADRDLLRPVPRTGHVRFRHPLLRRIAYDTAGSGWRVTAHGRVAAALAEAGAPAPEQARHVESSARRGDLAAAGVLQRAATETLHSSPGTAAHWLGVALRIVPDGQPHLALPLLALRSQSLAISGRLAESRDVLHRLREAMPPEVTLDRARLTGSCAGIERMLGRHREADALLRAELSRVTDPDGPAAATLLVALAAAHLQPRVPGEPGWSRRALAAARRADSPPLVADALLQCVLADQADDAWDATTAARLTEATALVDAMPDGTAIRMLHMLAWLATAEAVYERMDDVTRHMDRAVGLARATGQMYVMHGLHLLVAGVHLAHGDLQAAARSVDDAREATTLAGTDTMMSLVLTRESTLALLTGDVKLAHRAGEEALALAGRRPDYTTQVAAQALANACLHTGDPAACTTLLAGTEEYRSTPTMRATLYETLALAWAAQDRPDTAATWADRAAADVAIWSTPRRAGLAALARSHALRAVDAEAAATHARTAAGLFAAAGDRLMAGRAHLHLATALTAAGQSAAASHELDQARTLFAVCGATLFLDQTN